MSLEVIYVTRHGFRSSWSLDPHTGVYTASIRSPTGIPTDPALTSHGVHQSKQLAEHLTGVTPPVEQVYSSPYYRCLQTVQPFVSRHNRPCMQTGPAHQGQIDTIDDPFRIRAEAGLGEWFGLAKFEHPAPATPAELMPLFRDTLDADYASLLTPPRNGETIWQLHDRVAAAIEMIIERSDREGKKAVLVSTHAAVVIALGRVLTGRMPQSVETEDFNAFTCGLSVFRRRREAMDGDFVAASTADSSKTREANLGLAGHSDNTAMADLSSSRRAPSGTHSASNADHYESNEIKENLRRGGWWRGTGVCRGWDCEADSNTSFLREGSERGWKFAGDESFVDLEAEALLEPWPSLDGSEGLEGESSHCKLTTSNSKL